MTVFQRLLLVVFLFGNVGAGAAVASTHVQPIPREWALVAGPRSISAASLAAPARPPLSVRAFLSLHGLPDRYVVSRTAKAGFANKLVYDLPDGVTVTLDVAAPPNDQIGAIFVADKSGKQLRLIK